MTFPNRSQASTEALEPTIRLQSQPPGLDIWQDTLSFGGIDHMIRPRQ
jgi:hypothetical protein